MLCLVPVIALVIGCETSTVVHETPAPAASEASDAATEHVPEDGGSDAKPFAGSFGLVTAKATRIAKIAGTPPAAGMTFIVIEQKLHNESDPVPLPASVTRFSLESSDALVFPADARSSLLVPACAKNVAVAKAGSVTCKILFQVPMGAQPALLRYRDVDSVEARVATSPIPALTPAPNPLGILCGALHGDCPADSDAFCYFLGKFGSAYGSTTDGYCTRPCDDNASPACHAGYVGPTPGTTNLCVLLDTACTIGCVTDTDCPNKLKCLPTTGPIKPMCSVPAN